MSILNSIPVELSCCLDRTTHGREVRIAVPLLPALYLAWGGGRIDVAVGRMVGAHVTLEGADGAVAGWTWPHRP